MFSRAIRPPQISVSEKEQELRSQAEKMFKQNPSALFSSSEVEQRISEYVRVEIEQFKKDQQEEQLRTYIVNNFS